MKLAELARDRTLVPPSLSGEERSMRGGFIVVRVRTLRAAAPDPADIPDGDIPALRTQLAGEIAQAAAAYTAIRTRVNADAAGGKLLSLANVDARMRRKYLASGLLPGSLEGLRQRLVRSLVWWATGVHAALLSPARLDDLHLLVDRRLRIVERMLYDIGRVSRNWRVDQIHPNPGGAWRDGWNRMFEYPRIPQKLGDRGNHRNVFKGICNPDSSAAQLCQNPALVDWHVRGAVHLMLRLTTRLNPSVASLWIHNPNSNYEFWLKAGSDPVQAIEQLFIPSEDYKNRNLLFCDHVIHILHIEALLWARKKRSADTSWLTNYIGGTPNKLRITYPIPSNVPFLAGQVDGVFFEFQRIHVSQAQVGDHLIVYNHPAYDKATVGGVWRLENAIVVQVYPKRLLQGHGTNPLTLDEMKAQMIGLFNGETARLRKRVEDHLASGSTDTTINFGGLGTLVRRFPPAASNYIPSLRKADWWLRWPHDPEKDEAAIAADPDRRDLAKRRHKIEYDSTHGYFPLWEPVLRANGQPVLNSTGQFKRIQPVNITAKMVAAWTWHIPLSPAERDKLPVLRPRL
jgi:hypothetical protein